MVDNPEDLFESMNLNNPLGPYQSREMKIEVIDGEERITQIIHIEREVDGVSTVIEEVRFLCQSCGIQWVTPGIDGSTKNRKVLCKKCAKRAKIKAVFKPLWSPFVRFKE